MVVVLLALNIHACVAWFTILLMPFETSSNVSLGDLDDLHTNQSGVYWIDIDEDSKTCQYDRGIFNIS